MWETGYAMALGETDGLDRQDVDSLPFDLKVHRVLHYEPDALGALGPILAKAVSQTLASYDVKVSTNLETQRSAHSASDCCHGNLGDPIRHVYVAALRHCFGHIFLWMLCGIAGRMGLWTKPYSITSWNTSSVPWR